MYENEIKVYTTNHLNALLYLYNFKGSTISNDLKISSNGLRQVLNKKDFRNKSYNLVEKISNYLKVSPSFLLNDELDNVIIVNLKDGTEIYLNYYDYIASRSKGIFEEIYIKGKGITERILIDDEISSIIKTSSKTKNINLFPFVINRKNASINSLLLIKTQNVTKKRYVNSKIVENSIINLS